MSYRLLPGLTGPYRPRVRGRFFHFGFVWEFLSLITGLLSVCDRFVTGCYRFVTGFDARLELVLLQK